MPEAAGFGSELIEGGGRARAVSRPEAKMVYLTERTAPETWGFPADKEGAILCSSFVSCHYSRSFVEKENIRDDARNDALL